ncbi:NAD-dependent epimerase/dehydratase family protein [Paracoccus yeei]
MAMKVLLTGADGFLGRATAQALAAMPGIGALRLADRAFHGTPPTGAECLSGDLADPAFQDTLFADPPDAVIHLASAPGSLTEREPEMGWQANVVAPFGLVRRTAALRRADGGPLRLVFASSIAVYGDLGDGPVTTDMPTRPQLSYGAHKLMTETLISDLTRRGELSGVSLRLPGLVARPMSESGHGSAFMSRIIHIAAMGEAYDCPVPRDATAWWMSRGAAVAAMLHALADTGGPDVVQLPVLHLTVGQVAEAAAALNGHPLRVTWGDDPVLTRLFGRLPPLDTRAAEQAGYGADRDAAALVRAALVP